MYAEGMSSVVPLVRSAFIHKKYNTVEGGARSSSLYWLFCLHFF